MLGAGLLALAAAIGLYAANVALHPWHVLVSDVDLAVYRDAGLVARRSPDQLYRWRDPSGLPFTYTPFAAAFCMVMSLLPWRLLAWLMLTGSAAALLGTVWLTFGALGWHGTRRIGVVAAVSAVAFWTEPVQRTLHTGEVDLLLMLLVVRDLASRGRRWQGAGLGLAAGIKLVALIFVPYLLPTGRYRQAGAAAGAFAATVAAGALLFPRASASWWVGGTFVNARRTGFVGYLANQSLLGMTTRLAGTVPPAAAWLVLAVLASGPALVLAALVHRRGRPVHGWLLCAVTGLIVSPVSWDHHWVWIAPALAVLTDTAVRARPAALRAAWWGFGGLVAMVFGAWPAGGAAVPWGLIWYAPATPDDADPVHPEYHWTGWQLVAGNLYLLAGLVLLASWFRGARTTDRSAENKSGITVGGEVTAEGHSGEPPAGWLPAGGSRARSGPNRPPSTGSGWS